jgi:hypothetical protein
MLGLDLLGARDCVGWLSVCPCASVERLVGTVGMLVVNRLDRAEGG